jgi:hypothetical protein
VAGSAAGAAAVRVARELVRCPADALATRLAGGTGIPTLAAVLLVPLEADRGIDADRPAAALPLGTDALTVFAGPGAVAAWGRLVALLAREGAIRRTELVLLEERVTRWAGADALDADGVRLFAAVQIALALLPGTAADEGRDLNADTILALETRATALARGTGAVAANAGAG